LAAPQAPVDVASKTPVLEALRALKLVQPDPDDQRAIIGRIFLPPTTTFNFWAHEPSEFWGLEY